MPWNSQDSLYHHGIKGQKWGVRRYQNEDGTLTAAGREHYYGSGRNNKSDGIKSTSSKKNSHKGLSSTQKKILIAGGTALATGLAVYGGYKLNQYLKNNVEIKTAKEAVETALQSANDFYVENVTDFADGSSFKATISGNKPEVSFNKNGSGESMAEKAWKEIGDTWVQGVLDKRQEEFLDLAGRGKELSEGERDNILRQLNANDFVDRISIPRTFTNGANSVDEYTKDLLSKMKGGR